MVERQVIRLDETGWQQTASGTAPVVWPFCLIAGVASPSLVEAFDGITDDETMALLLGLLGRQAEPSELLEWQGLLQASRRPASAKRLCTARAAGNPAHRGPPLPVVRSPPGLEGNWQEARPSLGERPGSLGWWPRAGPRRPETDRKAERDKWARIAGDMVLSFDMPAVRVLELSATPEELAAKLCAGRRTSTIRKRVREAQKLNRWLMLTHKLHWLTSPSQLLDYLMDRAHEPCAPSGPANILGAVDFLEGIGGVLEGRRTSRHPTVQGLAKELQIELTLGRPAVPTRKAPPLLLTMLVSLEMLVVNTSAPTYTRVYGWCKLLRHWMALRWSDTLNMPPRMAMMTEAGLEVTITSTKTTGPGKKVSLLKAYVSKEAWLWEDGWLEVGWRLFAASQPPHGVREFFLPLQGKGGTVFSTKEPSYLDACGMTRKIYGLLTEVVGKRMPDNSILISPALDCRGSKIPLLLPGLQCFWTEHGDRSTLLNWAARLGYPKEVRDILGRWSAKGSDEYLRTSKATILETQAAIAKKVRGCSEEDVLGESDTLEKLKEYMIDRGHHDELVTEQFRRLSGLRVPECENVLRPADEDEGFVLVDEMVGAPVLSSEEEAVDEPDRPPGKGAWVISQVRQGKARTLHKVGECWRVPGRHYQWFTQVTEDQALEGPGGGMFEQACKQCFGDLRPGAVASSSSGSSSSDSS